MGCIVVQRDRVVGRGWTSRGGRPHAEANALAQAGSAACRSTIYVTLEPCAHRSRRGAACADLLVEAAPARVIVGVTDPDPRTAGTGLARLRDAGIDVATLDCPASHASLAGYLLRSRLGRPHVTLKLALSADGYIAPADRGPVWLTGEAARAHVHARRARADAICVGGETWRSDAPRLDVRLPGIEDRSAPRVVLTRDAVPDGVTAIRTPGEIAMLEGVQYLYLEGGAGAATAFLAQNLVDRVELYRAPVLLGDGLPAPADFAPAALAAAHGRWQLAERRQLGPDTFEAWDRPTHDLVEG